MSIRDSRYKPHFPAIIKLLSGTIKEMNTLFNNIKERKIRRRDKNIHKAMQITVDIYQRTEKFFVTVQPKMHVNWNLKIIYG